MVRRTIFLGGVLLVLAASLVSAQEGDRPRRGAPGEPGGMPGAPLPWLGTPEVQKELGVSDEQKQQLDDMTQELREEMRSARGSVDPQQMRDLNPEERETRLRQWRQKTEAVLERAVAKLGKILDGQQFQRFEQLRLQREGSLALTRADVAEKLGLTADQRAQILALLENARPQGRAGANPPEEDRRGAMRRMQEDREKLQADLLAVLTDPQKAKWEELQGKPFAFPMGRRGGDAGPRERGERRPPAER